MKSEKKALIVPHLITYLTTLVIARAKPVAIHWEPVSEETNPPAYPETRWIAASLAKTIPLNFET